MIRTVTGRVQGAYHEAFVRCIRTHHPAGSRGRLWKKRRSHRGCHQGRWRDHQKTIVKIDAVTAKIKDVKTAQEAADLVGKLLTTVLSIKSEVSGLENKFPAQSFNKTKLKEAHKSVMRETRAAEQRFGAALQALPEENRNSKEFTDAVKKLQDMK